MNISELVGQTFTDIRGAEVRSETVYFSTGINAYKMYHSQSCCEQVDLDDVCGDPADLIGSPIVAASEETNCAPPKLDDERCDESSTWTFYRLSTIKGSVTLKWYGSSNGWYSEDVDIDRINLADFPKELTIIR